ncbi:putative cytoplasmic protein [Paramagnetospirillum caucaseum]|uniref:Putative cytoplasmic protein n=1 Tax=Paramagnetospirillum caucaseum TaxID=1244869 RepID=M3AFF6_9PROT|nr:cell cycle transcriptional regulator TrcR [Paramagnetospirillum caucaseum]EME71309.1 putative cytoplasmic protein [Paramagnetospirillum caucaseum]
MALPLMPKATAVWLVENTALSFEQIADFCGLHPLEVQAIADGEVAAGIVGLDPVANGQVTRAELERCEANPDGRLKLTITDIPQPRAKPKGARYTPVSKRQDRPDAIAWIIKHHPELSDAAISKLVGTTKPTIQSVRDKSHWNAANIKPRNPVTLGMCTEAELEKVVALSGRSRSVVHNEAEPVHQDNGPAED